MAISPEFLIFPALGLDAKRTIAIMTPSQSQPTPAKGMKMMNKQTKLATVYWWYVTKKFPDDDVPLCGPFETRTEAERERKAYIVADDCVVRGRAVVRAVCHE
ncbi:MAG: hypothetical protein KGO50_17485 [Myxococcales bacterium]|nr:hypothetical protein [Myxococcales bacterium]